MTMACRIPSRRARRRLVLPVSRFTLATERDRRDTHRALDNGLRDLRRGARWRLSSTKSATTLHPVRNPEMPVQPEVLDATLQRPSAPDEFEDRRGQQRAGAVLGKPRGEHAEGDLTLVGAL
jgi:hypothetical protein